MSQTKIERLTPEQEAQIPIYRDKWIAIGLSTEPAERDRAESAINMAYEAAGLECPKKIVWCGSPLSQGLTRAIIIDKNLLKTLKAPVWDSVEDSVEASVRDSVGASVGASVWASVWASVRDSVEASVWASVGASVWASVRASVRDSVGDSVGYSVRDSVWASVRDSVWDSVWASVGASVRDSVGDSVWDSVWASVGASVRASVGDSVRASVWASVGDSVRASVWASVWDSGYGQHDANWLAFYEYFKDVVGLKKQTEKLNGLIEHGKSAGWYLPHKNICWVSERHNILTRDERGQLHNLTGPSVAYPDGWKIYAVNGVRVPDFVIENPKQITVKIIEEESNAEIRRVMTDKYGVARYLKDSNAKQISTDNSGILWRKEVANDEPIVMVQVKNSTPEPDGSFKDYFLRVPPDIKTPKDAVAWSFNLTTKEYEPIIET